VLFHHYVDGYHPLVSRFCDGRGARPRDHASRAALHWARGSARTGRELSPFSWPAHGHAARRRCRLRAAVRGKTPKPWPREAVFVPITVNRIRCCPLVSSRPLDTSIGPEGRRGTGLQTNPLAFGRPPPARDRRAVNQGRLSPLPSRGHARGPLRGRLLARALALGWQWRPRCVRNRVHAALLHRAFADLFAGHRRRSSLVFGFSVAS